MDETERDSLSARWRDATDEELAVAVMNPADFTESGQEVLRRELLERGLEPAVVRELAHATRLATVKRSVRIERAFAVVSVVMLALGEVVFVGVLNMDGEVNPTEVFSVVAVVAGVPFVAWFRQAYANLRLVGTRITHHEPGWAVGAWLVPFLNLWRPGRMMAELWVKSATHNVASRRLRPTLPIAWWIVFLAWRLPDGFVAVMLMRTDRSLSLAAAADWAYLRASQVLSVVAAFLLIWLIVQITRWQKQFVSSLPMAPLPADVQSWIGS